MLTYTEAKKAQSYIDYDVNGEWYLLAKRFPIWLRVAEHPTRIYLDTGGAMQDCEFQIVELREDGWIWALDAWRQDFRRTQNRWRQRA